MKQISRKAMLILALITTTLSFAQMKPMDGSKMAMSKYSFSETVDMVKSAIEDQNLMVISEIDGQKMMRMAGKQTKGMQQIFFMHPKYMRKVIEANKMAGIQIPLKLIVMENDKGVMIRYFMPSTVLKQYKGTEVVAGELDGLMSNIIAAVSK
ncbi:MAG: DUF302 domain-containing protein [Flavobacteriaceae bacterium]